LANINLEKLPVETGFTVLPGQPLLDSGHATAKGQAGQSLSVRAYPSNFLEKGPIRVIMHGAYPSKGPRGAYASNYFENGAYFSN